MSATVGIGSFRLFGAGAGPRLPGGGGVRTPTGAPAMPGHSARTIDIDAPRTRREDAGVGLEEPEPRGAAREGS